MNQAADHPIRIAIADDEQLVREGIISLLKNDNYTIVAEYGNAEELMADFPKRGVDVVLMDINMKGKGGVVATKWLTENRPKVKTIALTALTDDLSVIRMIKAGARAYLVKSSSAAELRQAVFDVHTKGYHFSDMVSSRMMKSMQPGGLSPEVEAGLDLSEREVTFLKLLCSELTNKEIADKMHVSPRTIETWHRNLCDRLGVQGRIGLALYASRNNLI
jgi:DNA-binding NarL/FixJ family response regulator